MADAALALGVQEKMLIELLINGLSVEMKTLTLTWEFARIPFHVLFLYLVPRIWPFPLHIYVLHKQLRGQCVSFSFLCTFYNSSYKFVSLKLLSLSLLCVQSKGDGQLYTTY